jgi:glycine/D-amino acid oxidase-like deaminating enzyme
MGCTVTVLEQGALPNPLGSSGDHHRLIRHAYGPELGYTRLMGPAYAAWELLWQTLGVCHHHHSGTLVMATDDLAWAKASLRHLETCGHAVEHLSATQMASDYPHLHAEGIDLSYRLPTGGVLMAQHIVGDLAQFLQYSGVTVAPGMRVAEVDPTRGSVCLEDGTRLGADLVVVAAGPWAARLLPSLGSQVTPSRQVIAYLTPPHSLREAWETSPMILDIGGAGGVYVVPPRGGAGLKVGDHSFSLTGDPDQDREPSQDEVDALVEACRGRLKHLDQYTVETSKTCFYTVEPQEHFIVQRQDRAWIMTGFSGHGFKFGALMGLMTAQAAMGFIPPQTMRALAAGQITDPAELARLTSPVLGHTSDGPSL